MAFLRFEMFAFKKLKTVLLEVVSQEVIYCFFFQEGRVAIGID